MREFIIREDDLTLLLAQAWDMGWGHSGEGYNAEYPFTQPTSVIDKQGEDLKQLLEEVKSKYVNRS